MNRYDLFYDAMQYAIGQVRVRVMEFKMCFKYEILSLFQFKSLQSG